MALPAAFQIKVKTKAEWEAAWAFLSNLYKITENSNEREYRRGCIIKVGHYPPQQLLWTSTLGETNSYKTYDSWEQFCTLHQGLVNPVIVKKMTLDVCHRLVAYDCELGCLQARVDNLREEYERQLYQLEGSISTLTLDMEALKAEYNVTD